MASSSSCSLSQSHWAFRFLFLHSQLCLWLVLVPSATSSGPWAGDWNLLPRLPIAVFQRDLKQAKQLSEINQPCCVLTLQQKWINQYNNSILRLWIVWDTDSIIIYSWTQNHSTPIANLLFGKIYKPSAVWNKQTKNNLNSLTQWMLQVLPRNSTHNATFNGYCLQLFNPLDKIPHICKSSVVLSTPHATNDGLD